MMGSWGTSECNEQHISMLLPLFYVKGVLYRREWPHIKDSKHDNFYVIDVGNEWGSSGSNGGCSINVMQLNITKKYHYG